MHERVIVICVCVCVRLHVSLLNNVKQMFPAAAQAQYVVPVVRGRQQPAEHPVYGEGTKPCSIHVYTFRTITIIF